MPKKVDEKFFTEKQGSGLNHVLIIAGAGVGQGDLEKVEGVQCLIDRRVKDDFVAWLRGQQIDDVARHLDVGRSTVHRLRKALGLTASYPGTSRTKAWRDAKKAAAGKP